MLKASPNAFCHAYPAWVLAAATASSSWFGDVMCLSFSIRLSIPAGVVVMKYIAVFGIANVCWLFPFFWKLLILVGSARIAESIHWISGVGIRSH